MKARKNKVAKTDELPIKPTTALGTDTNMDLENEQSASSQLEERLESHEDEVSEIDVDES